MICREGVRESRRESVSVWRVRWSSVGGRKRGDNEAAPRSALADDDMIICRQGVAVGFKQSI